MDITQDQSRVMPKQRNAVCVFVTHGVHGLTAYVRWELSGEVGIVTHAHTAVLGVRRAAPCLSQPCGWGCSCVWLQRVV